MKYFPYAYKLVIKTMHYLFFINLICTHKYLDRSQSTRITSVIKFPNEYSVLDISQNFLYLVHSTIFFCWCQNDLRNKFNKIYLITIR